MMHATAAPQNRSGPTPEGLENGHAAERFQAAEAPQGSETCRLPTNIDIREVAEGYHTEVKSVPHAAEVLCEGPERDDAKHCLHCEADVGYLVCMQPETNTTS